MGKRINIGKIQKQAYSAMDALDKFVSESSISPWHQELIRIKASQINGCAYCVDAHSNDAHKLGESIQRIFLICTWKEAVNVFTEEERAILQLTEEITLIHKKGLTDETYSKAINYFGREKTAALMMCIIAINGWNRIGIATQLTPTIREAQL